MVSPKWQIAGYHENTMIRGWLIVHPRGRGGDDGLLKNPRFPPFFRRCWMLLDGEKRTNGARGRIRTADTAIFNRMLYQLSYPGIASRRR